VLAPAFRLLDRLGVYQHFVDHQRLIHTFVSNVRGPEHTLQLLSCPLIELIPLSVTSGNVTVAFTALSYRGRFVITINADPGTCPDLDRLAQALTDQLHALDERISADPAGAAGGLGVSGHVPRQPADNPEE
jgi:hypothetical protein